MQGERHRFDVWSFMFGAFFAALAALTIWLPVEPGWMITIGRAMGPGHPRADRDRTTRVRMQGRRPDETSDPLPAGATGGHRSITWITPLPAGDVALEDGGFTDH